MQPLFCGTRVAQAIFGNAVIETKTHAKRSTARVVLHRNMCSVGWDVRCVTRLGRFDWNMQSAFHNFLLFNVVILTRPRKQRTSRHTLFSKNILFSLRREGEINKLSTFFDSSTYIFQVLVKSMEYIFCMKVLLISCLRGKRDNYWWLIKSFIYLLSH